MLKEFSLEGKTALVTGGGRGIGKAIALVLAEVGADVAVAARTLGQLEETADEIRSLGRSSIAIQVDVANSKQVDSMLERATRELGRIDILVNNAGIAAGGPVVPLPDGAASSRMSDETWREVIETNLNSTFYCCRAVAPQMIERRNGKIINVASTNSVLAYPDAAPYQSSKAAIKMLTKALATEWAPYNLNVNGIGPGWFVTDMTMALFEDPEFHKEALDQIPLGRLTDLRDLGLLAVYLASSASDWMTGQMIFLDGGETAILN